MRLDELRLTLANIELGGIDAESDRKLDEYFVQTPYVGKAFEGDRTLFLGRKGSGKSALFGQLPRLAVSNGHPSSTVISITPDQYAWAALRRYQEQGILVEQAHTNAWTLTLVMEIAARLASMERQWDQDSSKSIDALRKFVEQNCGCVDGGFLRTVNSVLKGLSQFNFSAFGFGLGMQLKSDHQATSPTVVPALIDALRRPLGTQRVLVALDRLDDSWDGSESSLSVMVGLLKAAKYLNDQFPWRKGLSGLRVLVFLRTDIYDALRFDDKDKHRPTEEHISWTPHQLKMMLQRRLPADVFVDDLFETGDMRGSISSFNYIVKRTFLRPREVLQFVGECIRQVGGTATKITKDSVRAAEDRYSGWKVSDLKQEYSKVFPEYEVLLECLRQEVHRYDSIADLEHLLERKQEALVTKHGVRELLKALFDSSVIGVRLGDAGSTRFKCEDSELALPTLGAVYVHQSLYRGLKIRETRKAAADDEARERHARATIDLQTRMMRALPVQDMTWFGLKPTPVDIFQHEDFSACMRSLGLGVVEDETVESLRMPNEMSPMRQREDETTYATLRQDMLTLLAQHNMTVAEYITRPGAGARN